MNKPGILRAAQIYHWISKGRHPLRPWLVLPPVEATRFLSDPERYQTIGKKQWVAEAITIAKLICELVGFLETYVCPIVRKIPLVENDKP